jgi:hypothetical protein
MSATAFRTGSFADARVCVYFDAIPSIFFADAFVSVYLAVIFFLA